MDLNIPSKDLSDCSKIKSITMYPDRATICVEKH